MGRGGRNRFCEAPRVTPSQARRVSSLHAWGRRARGVDVGLGSAAGPQGCGPARSFAVARDGGQQPCPPGGGASARARLSRLELSGRTILRPCVGWTGPNRERATPEPRAVGSGAAKSLGLQHGSARRRRGVDGDDAGEVLSQAQLTGRKGASGTRAMVELTVNGIVVACMAPPAGCGAGAEGGGEPPTERGRRERRRGGRSQAAVPHRPPGAAGAAERAAREPATQAPRQAGGQGAGHRQGLGERRTPRSSTCAREAWAARSTGDLRAAAQQLRKTAAMLGAPPDRPG